MVSLISLLTGPRIFSTASGRVMPCDRLAVDMRDEVAGLQPGARRRRVVDRRDHLDQAVLHRDLDAEPAELAAGLHLHVAEVLGVHVARMRVERGQHAVDRGFDQLLVGDLLDIVGAHALEHLAEQVELPIGVGRVGCRRRRRSVSAASAGAARASQTIAPRHRRHRDRDASSTYLFIAGRQPWQRVDRLAVVAQLEIKARLRPRRSGMTPTGSPATSHWPTAPSIRSSPASSE